MAAIEVKKTRKKNKKFVYVFYKKLTRESKLLMLGLRNLLGKDPKKSSVISTLSQEY
jgi:hypothetical protein